jgi:exodeoxyribonuclease VII small subunit
MARSSDPPVDAAASKGAGARKSAAARKSTGAAEQSPELPFEEALSRLEQIVDRLEQGDLALEKSLAVFEEGVRLSSRCAGELDAAERRIEVLTREGGAWLARPFDADLSESDVDVERSGSD